MKQDTVYYTIIKKKNLKFNNETKQAHEVLNKMLNYFNIEMSPIYTSKIGKPYFKNSNIFFNYSHSKTYIACAISYHEVGIDIEETDKIINKKMIEACYLDNSNPLKEFVQKESYSKLKGIGLKMLFNKIDLKSIKEKNIIIKNKNYICSIYSSYDYVNFKQLHFKKINF